MSQNPNVDHTLTPEAFEALFAWCWDNLRPNVPQYVCKFCGAPSWLAPSEQEMPPDYCHEADHGSPDS